MSEKFFVYILRSTTTKRCYVGSTQNIDDRISRHNSGRSLSTKAGLPWKLVHVEEFANRGLAIKKELWIKKRGIGRYLESIGKGPA